MDRSSKLIPESLKAWCYEIRKKLSEENDQYSNVIKSIDSFINDQNLEGEAYAALKEHVSDYIIVANGIIAANDNIILSIDRLVGNVGYDNLVGDYILRQIELYAIKISEAYQNANYWNQQKERAAADPLVASGAVANPYSGSNPYDKDIDDYKEIQNLWIRKRDRFDEINELTMLNMLFVTLKYIEC